MRIRKFHSSKHMSNRMKQPSRNQPTTPTRSECEVFLETARQLEADEKKSAANALMGKLAHRPRQNQN
ncbi:hypothetical protein X752_24975 [Mesorhizobium sp. LNJC398B00]|nr:hypothetical protein X752_24975 [Mesorhizobium sp. LNJC398B00]